MTRLLRAVLLAVMLGASTIVTAQSNGFVEAASGWLKLLDAQNYSATWNEAGSIFQTALTLDDWSKKVGQDRAALGVVIGRKVIAAEQVYPQGLPSGEYAKVVYQATFSKAGELQEVLSLQKAADMQWRIAGYLVK